MASALWVGGRSFQVASAELGACLEESFSSLRLMGIECALTAPAGERIYVRYAEENLDRFITYFLFEKKSCLQKKLKQGKHTH